MAAILEARNPPQPDSDDPHELDRAFAEALIGHHRSQPAALPSKHDVEGFVDNALALLFPQHAEDVAATEGGVGRDEHAHRQSVDEEQRRERRIVEVRGKEDE